MGRLNFKALRYSSITQKPRPAHKTQKRPSFRILISALFLIDSDRLAGRCRIKQMNEVALSELRQMQRRFCAPLHCNTVNLREKESISRKRRIQMP